MSSGNRFVDDDGSIFENDVETLFGWDLASNVVQQQGTPLRH